MMMMMNCFCGMVDRQKAFNFISSLDHCQRSSPSRIPVTPRAGFKPAENLSSGLVERRCAAVITTTPWKVLVKTSTRELFVKFFSTTLQRFKTCYS